MEESLQVYDDIDMRDRNAYNAACRVSVSWAETFCVDWVQPKGSAVKDSCTAPCTNGTAKASSIELEENMLLINDRDAAS